MRILFVHQNFPGQFPHLSHALARSGHECVVLTDEKNLHKTELRTYRYRFQPSPVDPAATRLGRNYTLTSDRGAVVARVARRLRDDEGFTPDLIIGHSGWGEMLFLDAIWPDAKQLIYSEFYYQGRGADTGFDPEFSTPSLEGDIIARARSSYLAQSLAHADRAIAPTQWQASVLPRHLRHLVEVIFDGVDTDRLRPDPNARFHLPNGEVLHAGKEVLTFVNRNLEPYRGYHIFMRALPAVLRARPDAQVVIVGGDEVSYGPKPPEGESWKERFLAEVRDQLDMSRVHFTGKIPYADFTRLMQVSRVHAYLTYPFVLSWSMVEAMAMGALVLGSRTKPVEEIIEDGKNGRLIDFFDVAQWSAQITEALANPDAYAPLRAAARATIVARYDLRRHCLPRQIALVESLGPRRSHR